MSDAALTNTPHNDLLPILERQRAAFVHAGPADVAQRRADLRRLKAES